MGADSVRPVVTATDIARQLGLSRTTVSMVLRGEARKRQISQQTRDRILAAAKELNYAPNLWARNLRRQSSGMVGVIFVNFSLDWAQQVVSGMTCVLEAAGYSPFVAIHDWQRKRARRELLSCLQRRDDAVIMQPVPSLTDLYMGVRQAGVPLVFLGDRPGDMPDASFVAWDSAPDTRLAVEHLIRTGRRRIAYLGYKYPMPINENRFEMFALVLQEAGLPLNRDWVTVSPIESDLDRIADRALSKMFNDGQNHPDAIFAQNDGLAIPLLSALRSRGVRVPDDVAVVGMGDYPITSHEGISLSTTREPLPEMGREAALAVIELIRDPAQAPIQRLVPGGELRIRRTTSSAGPSRLEG